MMNGPVLVILTLALDRSHSALSHQVEVVNQLAARFKETIVLTHSLGDAGVSNDIKVYSTKILGTGKIKSLKTLIKNIRAISLEVANKEIVIFSHMNPIYSVFWVLFGRRPKKHWLWYAHTSSNFWLHFLKGRITGFVTSTDGSFPRIGTKPVCIGQGIDDELFPNLQNSLKDSVNFLHIGRLDPSKNLIGIVNAVTKHLQSEPKSRLIFFGEISSRNARYVDQVIERVGVLGLTKQVLLGESFKRQELRSQIPKSTIFVHAFQGSLDKAILEANLMGIPVATINVEYLREFGPWSGKRITEINLEEEIEAIRKLTPQALNGELSRRREITLKEHSFRAWINKIERILTSN
jgi:hypothetical protein